MFLNLHLFSSSFVDSAELELKIAYKLKLVLGFSSHHTFRLPLSWSDSHSSGLVVTPLSLILGSYYIYSKLYFPRMHIGVLV